MVSTHPTNFCLKSKFKPSNCYVVRPKRSSLCATTLLLLEIPDPIVDLMQSSRGYLGAGKVVQFLSLIPIAAEAVGPLVFFVA